VSGASGFLGTAVCRVLEREGWEIFRLTRRPRTSEREIEWDPGASRISAAELEGHDLVLHLSGATVATRWTRDSKERIWQSRVDSTRLLAETLSRLARPPATFISVSGIGIYGDRGEELLDESSASGAGFLARLAVAWEHATTPAADAGIRVVIPRLGMVIGAGGGALAPMLLPFRLGLGGPLGGGRAWWSWIALDDVISGIQFAIRSSTLAGPVNFVAPVPVRSGDFVRALGRALRRPAFLPVPAALLRLVLGEMADEVVLSSAFVHPVRLLATGFPFRHPHLESALAAALNASGD